VAAGLVAECPVHARTLEAEQEVAVGDSERLVVETEGIGVAAVGVGEVFDEELGVPAALAEAEFEDDLGGTLKESPAAEGGRRSEGSGDSGSCPSERFLSRRGKGPAATTRGMLSRIYLQTQGTEEGSPLCIFVAAAAGAAHDGEELLPTNTMTTP
jgi:hypothetical protein